MVNRHLFRSTPARPTSEATSTDTLTDTLQHTEEAQHFLPGNPPVHLTPSFTLQPEILAFHFLFLLVTRLFEHPITNGPVPSLDMFWDHTAYAVYYQYHRSVLELGRATMRLKRARRLL